MEATRQVRAEHLKLNLSALEIEFRLGWAGTEPAISREMSYVASRG